MVRFCELQQEDLGRQVVDVSKPERIKTTAQFRRDRLHVQRREPLLHGRTCYETVVYLEVRWMRQCGQLEFLEIYETYASSFSVPVNEIHHRNPHYSLPSSILTLGRIDDG